MEDDGACRWWVIPTEPENDERFEAIGPFETAEQAVVYCSLMDGT